MEVKATLYGPVTLGSLQRVLTRFERAGVGLDDEVQLSRNRDGSKWTIMGYAPDEDTDALEDGGEKADTGGSYHGNAEAGKLPNTPGA